MGRRPLTASLESILMSVLFGRTRYTWMNVRLVLVNRRLMSTQFTCANQQILAGVNMVRYASSESS